MRRSVVMYARISIATEESVSIARQLEAGRQYARARGWKLVGTYVDEVVIVPARSGSSATKVTSCTTRTPGTMST